MEFSKFSLVTNILFFKKKIYKSFTFWDVPSFYTSSFLKFLYMFNEFFQLFWFLFYLHF